MCFFVVPPPCKGIALPSSTPFFFERFYLEELPEFILDGKKRGRIPCYINVYRDTIDLLFSMIFCRVPDVSKYEIVEGVSRRQLSKMAKQFKKCRVITLVCYYKGRNLLYIAVFECLSKRQFKAQKTEYLLNVPYDEYQQRLLQFQENDIHVYRRNIYLNGGNLFVNAIFRRADYGVSLRDGINLNTLIQVTERNKERGFFLADGNARMEGEQVIYSVVFTTERYGNCECRVEYNVDALQLFNREQQYARQGCHITVLIPNTGSLTPQYIAVFWCTD